VRVPLRRRVSLFVTVLVLGASVLGTGLSVLVLRRTVDREIGARGTALVVSLARAAEEGVAAEDLDLLRKAAHVVQAEDVVFAAVYSSVWTALDAYPFERLREDPAPEALAHYRAGGGLLRVRDEAWEDFYSPVVFRAAGLRPVTIGYARIALSTADLRRWIRLLVAGGALGALLFTVLVVAVSNRLAGRFVVEPILALHRDVERFREGQLPVAPAGPAGDEIGELHAEFAAVSRAVREREEQLRESESRNALLLSSMAEGMYGVDARGSCTFVNAAFLRILGYERPGDLVGKNLHEMIHHSRADGSCYPEEECTIFRAFREGRGFHSDAEVFWRTDGTSIPVEFWSYPILAAGRVLGAVVTFVDVTERKRLEAEVGAHAAALERQNAELRSLDVMKDALIRDVTHELKTPVAKQAMQVELLRRVLGPESPQAAGEALEAMERSIRRQAQVIRNLLDLSRLESGGRRYTVAPLQLEELVREVLEDYRGTLGTGAVALETDLVPVRALGDREMLWHVVSNLLNNALKFLEPGRPGRIRVTTAAEGGRAVVRVADNGTGLSAEELGRAFEKFYQGSASIEGAGVGLSISRTIVEELGGTVTLESPGRGGGATATVSLPLA